MIKNKYVVKVANVFANYIEVEADNKEEARTVAASLLHKEDIAKSFKHYYEATIPPEHWGIITKDEFDKLQEEKEAEEVAEQKN